MFKPGEANKRKGRPGKAKPPSPFAIREGPSYILKLMRAYR